jgi:hypothetical protein
MHDEHSPGLSFGETCLRAPGVQTHPGGNIGANLKLISHKGYLFEVAFLWELIKETIYLPRGCLQGGFGKISLRAPRVQTGFLKLLEVINF